MARTKAGLKKGFLDDTQFVDFLKVSTFLGIFFAALQWFEALERDGKSTIPIMEMYLKLLQIPGFSGKADAVAQELTDTYRDEIQNYKDRMKDAMNEADKYKERLKEQTKEERQFVKDQTGFDETYNLGIEPLPFTPGEQQAWATYIKDLRNIPLVSSAGNLARWREYKTKLKYWRSRYKKALPVLRRRFSAPKKFYEKGVKGAWRDYEASLIAEGRTKEEAEAAGKKVMDAWRNK